MRQVLIKTILDLPQKVYAAINENLKPNPKYTPTPLQQEIAHKRNKAFFTMLFLYQFLFIYDVVINNGSLTKNLISLATIYFIYFILFISCRYHPQIFNCYYGLICLSFGPSTMDGGPESIAHAFMATNFISLIVQVVTGSYTHYIFQAIGQAVLLNTVYQKPLEEMIFSNPPERVLHYFTHAANFILLLQAFVVVLIHRFLAQTQQQALVLEQRKNEAETQKTFLLSFSHELRNLINSLTGNVKLASLENIGGRAKDFLLNAEVCGELLLHLINNILDTGKVSIGELEIHPVSTNTYDTFERIWGICSELIRRKDLKGSMKIPRNLPRTIMIDPHRLTQIFLNLVGNSIKFTDKGSIDLTIEWLPNRNMVNEKCFQPYPFNTSDEQDEGLFEKQERFTILDDEYSVLTTSARKLDARQLQPAIATSKGVLKMIVTDKGCGMSKEQTEKLFQKFMQVTTDATKKKLGTGLGLYITKQLCQRMEGEIRVFSQKDKGSSFVFCIPVDVVFENNHLINNHEPLKSRLLEKNLRAMIVDDIPSNHIILKTFFENLGIQVSDIALNGFEAYQKYSDDAAHKKCPQIIAMDLDMPIMNGKEASQKIREFEAKNELSPAFLLIISGNCLESEIAECLNKEGRIRADAFLRKPLKIEDLTRVVISHFIKD